MNGFAVGTILPDGPRTARESGPHITIPVPEVYIMEGFALGLALVGAIPVLTFAAGMSIVPA